MTLFYIYFVNGDKLKFFQETYDLALKELQRKFKHHSVNDIFDYSEGEDRYYWDEIKDRWVTYSPIILNNIFVCEENISLILRYNPTKFQKNINIYGNIGTGCTHSNIIDCRKSTGMSWDEERRKTMNDGCYHRAHDHVRVSDWIYF